MWPQKQLYRQRWDAKCESLYQAFLKAPSGEKSNKAASDLLAQIDKKRRELWSISISLTSRTPVGWPTLNQVTLLTQEIENKFSVKNKAGAVFIPHSNSRYRMALRLHLQTFTPSTGQAYDFAVDENSLKLQFYSCHW